MLLGLTRLEDRIVFDGADAGDQNADADAFSAAAEKAGPDRILAVDLSVENADKLISAAKDGVTVVTYDSRVNTLQEIRDMIASVCGDRLFSSVAFAGHGGAGETILAVDAVLNLAELTANPELAAFFDSISALLEDGGRIDLLGCNIAAGELGGELVDMLEEVTGIDFAASDNATGNDEAGGDWLLETDDVDAADAYFDADLLAEFTSVLEGNYLIDYGIISHPETSEREIDLGDALWDDDFLKLHQPPGDMGKLEVSLTLTKNGEPLNLADYLTANNGLTWQSDNGNSESGAFTIELSNITYTLPGIRFENGSIVFSFCGCEDYGMGPYGFETMYEKNDGSIQYGGMSIVNIFGYDALGDAPPAIIFASLPDGDAADVFAMEWTATAYAVNDTVIDRYTNNVDLNFKNLSTEPEPSEPEPTEPEPTEPEPTEPEPTEPEPTEPEPTEPEPTEPEPTEPEPTEPEPTEPEPIDPNPVEPEPTDPETIDPTPEETEDPSYIPPDPSAPGNSEGVAPETGNGDTPQAGDGEQNQGETPAVEPPPSEAESGSEADTDTGTEESAGEEAPGESEGGDDAGGEDAPKEEAGGEEAPSDEKAGDSAATGDGDAADLDNHDMEALRHRAQEEEEIVKSYPEEMQMEVREVVSFAGQAADQGEASFAAITVSMAELGESLSQFNSALTRMIAMLASLNDFGGDDEIMDWIQEVGHSREQLLLASSEHVSLLLEAVRTYKALPAERRDSVALDSVAELNGAIDEVNRQLRSVIAGMAKMSSEIAEMRDNGGTAVLAARLPGIREHMKSIAEDIMAVQGKRDSMFFDLRNAAAMAGRPPR